MNDEVFLISNGGELHPLIRTPYSSEATLQKLLAKYPDLISGYQINPADPRRWLFVSREKSVPSEEGGAGRWSLDHLFIDQDGIPTLIEVKRSTNREIRREIVGQMLDYAANAVVYWSLREIQEKFAETCCRLDVSETEELTKLLGPDGDDLAFWTSVKTNLEAGKIRMLFVADIIPDELRRIVEFMNEQMDPAEVLAVEIPQYGDETTQTLIPRVYGRTAEAEKKKSVVRREQRKWDCESFLEDLKERKGGAAEATARRIIEWILDSGVRVWWGKGAVEGSCYAMLDLGDVPYYSFTLWTYGRIAIEFGNMTNEKYGVVGEETREELRNRLNKIDGVALPDDAVGRFPSFEIELLNDEASLQMFLGAFTWYYDELRQRHGDS